MSNRVSQKYLEQQILSASPAKLVAMLYERAITLLHQTIKAIEAGNIEARWQANGKATDVICHLWDTLDRERGGDVAENLNRLYGFMVMRLTMVDVENSAQAARDVIRLLEPLQRSWREVAHRDEQKSVPSEIPSNGAPIQITISA